MPRVFGPIQGGERGRHFGAYLGDIGVLGYVEEEYFLEGEATRYVPVSDLSLDGRWTLREGASDAYRTRIIVRRPIDPARFNGTVIVSWTNVSAGFEHFSMYGGMDGLAHVAVSAQPTGIDGYRSNNQGLRAWDPKRYGSLLIPDEATCYDIFTQAALAVSPSRSTKSVDPMGGLDVRKLVAIGVSQSGTRIMAYLNGIQPLTGVFDAFSPIICAGTAADFEPELAHPDPADVEGRHDTLTEEERTDPQAALKAASTNRGHSRSVPALVRADLSVPVMPLNTETEAFVYFPRRQPETEKFCYWEIAGASHAGGPQRGAMDGRLARDGGIGSSEGSGEVSRALPSLVDARAVYDTAMHHIHRWITTGEAPPRQEPIEITGSPPAIIRDEYGNAKGGIRLPELDVPIATYRGMNDRGSIAGVTMPFSPEVLHKLYPTHSEYVANVALAALRAEQAGVISFERAEQYISDARTAPIPG